MRVFSHGHESQPQHHFAHAICGNSAPSYFMADGNICNIFKQNWNTIVDSELNIADLLKRGSAAQPLN